jgi:hypothetical protein
VAREQLEEHGKWRLLRYYPHSLGLASYSLFLRDWENLKKGFTRVQRPHNIERKKFSQSEYFLLRFKTLWSSQSWAVSVIARTLDPLPAGHAHRSEGDPSSARAIR